MFHKVFLFLFTGKVHVFVNLFAFFDFLSEICRTTKYTASFLLLLLLMINTPGLVLCPELGDPFVSQNPKEFYDYYYYHQHQWIQRT